MHYRVADLSISIIQSTILTINTKDRKRYVSIILCLTSEAPVSDLVKLNNIYQEESETMGYKDPFPVLGIL